MQLKTSPASAIVPVFYGPYISNQQKPDGREQQMMSQGQRLMSTICAFDRGLRTHPYARAVVKMRKSLRVNNTKLVAALGKMESAHSGQIIEKINEMIEHRWLDKPGSDKIFAKLAIETRLNLMEDELVFLGEGDFNERVATISRLAISHGISVPQDRIEFLFVKYMSHHLKQINNATDPETGFQILVGLYNDLKASLLSKPLRERLKSKLLAKAKTFIQDLEHRSQILNEKGEYKQASYVLTMAGEIGDSLPESGLPYGYFYYAAQLDVLAALQGTIINP